MGDWVSLHHHTTYSYLDGFGQPQDHVDRAADLDMSALAFTEHGNVTSQVKLEKAAKAAGIKPIFGCELYTGGVGDAKGRYKWHLTVLAQNQQGLANLNALVSEGWASGFYYEPTVSGEMLAARSEGLIVLSGCSGSKMACDLLGGKGVEPHAVDYQAAKETALKFRELLGERFFLEAQAFPELERTRSINKAWQQMSSETGIPLVVTGDVHYPKAKDSEMQVMLHAIDRGGKNNTVEKQAQSWGYDIKLTTFSDEVIVKKLMATGLDKKQALACIKVSADIANMINVELPKFQELTFPGKEPSEQLFRTLIKEGWVKRGFNKLPDDLRRQYSDRIKYEANLIENKGYVDYFLVVSDMVRYAKGEGIPVGPARGSAAASLICYCMAITEVNPMLFPNLLFERFIDVNRHDIPDIDLDFDDEQRWKVRAYLVEQYGEERVGNIGTFTNYKGKNSLDDVARVNKVPKWATDGIKEMLIERASGDLRGNATIEDTIEMFPKVKAIFEQFPVLYQAQRLEGNLKGFSVHASGLVVANEPLTNSVATYERRDSKGNVIGNVLSIDKHDAEYINAMKIDVLGLTTMGMINRCLKMVGMTLEELYAVPLDEEAVFEGFRRNEVIGIFQFDGRAMRSVNREVKPINFAEVCDINALARPGPLHSGAAAEYIMVKHGKKTAEILHSIVGEITAHTNQQIVYQEQILQVVRRLGNFTWEEAALIRKLISKKQGEQAFNRMMSKFIKGAKENGLSEGNAIKVWKQLVTAGAYAFCLSESTLVYRGGVGGVPKDGRTVGNDETITLGELSDLIHKKGDNSTNGCVVCSRVEKWHYVGDKRRLYYSGRCRRCKSWYDQFRYRGFRILSMDDDGVVRPRQLADVSPRVMKPLVRLKTSGGKEVQGSPEHPVLTDNGYKNLEDIVVGDLVACVGEKPAGQHLAPRNKRASFYKEEVLDRSGDRCEHCDKSNDGTSHCLEFAHVLSLDDLGGDRSKYDHPRNVLRLCNSCHKKFDYGKGERKKRWTRGRPVVYEEVVVLEGAGVGWVCDVEMADPNHNYVGNGIISHNNAAHCVSYGMLAYWTMWLKQHYPLEFYCAALQKYDPKTKGFDLLKEAILKGIAIQPPDPIRSGRTWRYDKDANSLLAGFEQISGIGESTADKMLEFQDTYAMEREVNPELPLLDWSDFTRVAGIGPVTIEKIKAFVSDDDPFNVQLLGDTLSMVRRYLWFEGESDGWPFPTSKSDDVPYEAKRGNHVWLGMVRERNLKDIYELHRSRTGEELDPATVKEPNHVNYVVVLGEDETGPLTITIHRFRGLYDKYKDAIWNMDVKRDLLLVKGYKRAEYRRALYATEIWVVNPDNIKRRIL